LDFLLGIALITAGLTLGTGITNIFIGSHKDAEKMERIFGIMCLCLFVFLMLPPFGFVLNDKPPYSASIDIKRIFIWSYYILLPLFFDYYIGKRRSSLTLIIGVLWIATYTIMAFTPAGGGRPIWLALSLIPYGLILFHGLSTAIKQIRSDQKRKGWWLLVAISIYGILYVFRGIDFFANNYLSTRLGIYRFFPIHLHSLFFVLIMSVRLRANIFEKYKLQKHLLWRDVRWNSIVENMQLLIVELDTLGKIKYLNNYAIKALGYQSLPELVDKDWFQYFSSPQQVEHRRTTYIQNLKERIPLHWTSSIITRNKTDLIVNWTNVFVYNNDAEITGTMSIGLNITEREKAFKEIAQLRIELEKDNLVAEAEVLSVKGEHNIVGQSEAILYAIGKAKQVARSNATVLLEGETGVGKELFASLIHKNSERSNNSLITVNCAALPTELIESELFGHEKGSFTGALQTRKGRFELANGGTIFLDEIGELPLALQPKLLRVLQSGEFQRIGAQETIKVDVRVISATNRDLAHAVKAAQFREDLYYRLNVFPITIPPLRNRKEDIPLLVKYFMRKYSDEHHKQIENISRADLTRLCEYTWPGNVRELINVMERSIISSNGNTVKLDWIRNNLPADDEPGLFSMEDVERAHILKVLKDCNWKINGNDGAAVKLGLNPNTLRSRLKKLNISRYEA
jgi:PAS domain S-box-containing protein